MKQTAPGRGRLLCWQQDPPAWMERAEGRAVRGEKGEVTEGLLEGGKGGAAV